MKAFVVTARFTDGRTDFFKHTQLEVARAKFNEWMADIQSVYVSIN